MIHIIDKVSLTSNGLVATGTKDLIHLHQGDMDGACAVYSLMMCLIINRSIKRLDVTDLDKKHDGRSSKGRLVDAFLNNAKGLVREGYELEVLNTKLLHAFKKCVSTAWYSTENAKKQELYAIIKSSLDEHSPIELGFSWKRKGGHAITVIGYEEQKAYLRLFCLDPGYPLQEGQYWNNVLDIDIDNGAKFNTYNHQESRYGREVFVSIEDVLVIQKA